eukprot:2599569-Alexandrium_andersonii.AAC.1
MNRAIAGLTRAFVLQAEKNYDMRATARDRVVVWAVRHAAWIHNRYHKLGGGHTPYFHMNGV